jgi:hypothetical protein
MLGWRVLRWYKGIPGGAVDEVGKRYQGIVDDVEQERS